MMDPELYLRIYGRMVRLTAVCTKAEANPLMIEHANWGVIAIHGEVVLLADITDLGRPVTLTDLPRRREILTEVTRNEE